MLSERSQCFTPQVLLMPGETPHRLQGKDPASRVFACDITMYGTFQHAHAVLINCAFNSEGSACMQGDMQETLKKQ